LRFEKSQRDPTTLTDKLEQFLGEPASESAATNSAVTEHYRATFNAVDRFDTYMGHIPWELKVDSIKMLVFISVVRLAAVNSYTLLRTHLKMNDNDDFEPTKAYMQRLSQCLLEEQ